MATFFRVHPDKSNRDIFDEESRLYDADLNPVEPETVHSNDILICATAEEFDTIQSARQ
jgi:hypothetical protein